MPNWNTIAEEEHGAAVLLAENGFYRSVINRYYYAAFHLLTEKLIELGFKKEFHKSRATPGHQELPGLIELAFSHLTQRKRMELASAIIRLYRRRITADYSIYTIDAQYVNESDRCLQQITRILGVAV